MGTLGRMEPGHGPVLSCGEVERAWRRAAACSTRETASAARDNAVVALGTARGGCRVRRGTPQEMSACCALMSAWTVKAGIWAPELIALSRKFHLSG